MKRAITFTENYGLPETFIWCDHSLSAGWYDTSDIEPNDAIYTCITIGWVIAETEEIVCVAGTLKSDNLQSATRQYILKSCIVERKKVKV
jgi:hypothetical protein